MQGITLLVSGYVFLACLAAPGVLFASAEPEPGFPGDGAAAPAPTGDEQQPVEPAGAGEEPGGGASDDGVPAATDPGPSGATNEPAATPPTTARSGRAGARRGARAAAIRTVAMRNIEFKPRNITIDVGDVVRWRNEDDVPHDALGRNNSFETPVIEGGETSQQSFDEGGRYPYFCSIHQGMTGTIQVGSSGTGAGGGSGSGDTSTGSGGSAAAGGTSGTGIASGTGGTTGFGSSGSTGTTSTLPATGSDVLWLGLVGYGLLALGAFVRLGAIGR